MRNKFQNIFHICKSEHIDLGPACPTQHKEFCRTGYTVLRCLGDLLRCARLRVMFYLYVTKYQLQTCLTEIKMMYLHDLGLKRELPAISSVLLCTLLNGYIIGFSSVAVPDIKEDMRWRLEGSFTNNSDDILLQEKRDLHRFTQN